VLVSLPLQKFALSHVIAGGRKLKTMSVLWCRGSEGQREFFESPLFVWRDSQFWRELRGHADTLTHCDTNILILSLVFVGRPVC
jgi:hypothetical protein